MKKKNIITFIPKNEFVNEYAPKPEPMSKNLPTWWRKSQAYVGGERQVVQGMYNETIKKCPGILDIITTGYVLKTPCDVFIDATGDRVEFQVPSMHRESIGMHSREQVESWDFDREIYMDDIFRIHPMWVVGTQKGISTIFIHPSFQDSLPLTVVPAIIDTDMYISDGPFSFRVKRGFKGVIEKGTPIVQCIPYRREEFEANILEMPDLKALESVGRRLRSKFGGSYKATMWEKKVFK